MGKKSVTQVTEEFLNDQRQRLSEKSFRQYESIIDLYCSYLNSYWPGHPDEAGDDQDLPGHTYADRYGPEEILGGFDEFLGYFMPRKVMAGQDTMRAAGTVTGKLAAWLAERGYIEKQPEEERKAARKGSALVKCRKAERVLDEFTRWHAPASCSSEIEDHFWVKRVEPGQLWLQPLTERGGTVGPIAVPPEATENLSEGCDIGGVVGKYRGKWHLVEVWNVSPEP